MSFCFLFVDLVAQDPNFSNIHDNILYYNPAYVGIDYGLRINATYRRQWPNIPSKFQTLFASVDQSIRIIRGTGGLGLMAVSDTEGEGVYQTTTLGIPFSARIPIFEKAIIQIGIMPSISLNRINWDKFVFNGMLDPFYGIIKPYGSIMPYEGVSNKFFLDIFNIGAVFRYENNSFEANSSRAYRKFEVGLSGFHLSQPNQSFTGSHAPLYRKYVLFTSYTTSVSLHYDGFLLIEPSVFCELQWKMFSYMAGFHASFSDFNMDFGIWYRSRNFEFQNTEAIVGLIGYQFILDQNRDIVLKAAFSYDFTVSRLSDVTRGSPEITLILNLNNSSFFSDKPDVCDEEVYSMKRIKKNIRNK